MEAFTYCWTDLGLGKLYVGVHKGRPTDNYICSSKLMLEQYASRPEDFSRQILAYGSYDDMIGFETAILTSVDAKNDSQFYNCHNGDGQFFNKGHSVDAKESLRKAWVARKQSYPKGTFSGRKHSPETKAKMAAAKLGKSLSEAHKANIKVTTIAVMQTPEYKKNLSDGVKANWIKRRGTQNRG